MTGGYGTNIAALMRCFYGAAVLLLLLAVGSVYQARQEGTQKKILENLNRARAGFAKVKDASANRKQVLAALQSQFRPDARSSSPEMILYGKVDTLMADLKPDDMTISTLEKKGGEASIQYVITFNNPDYDRLLNIVSSLHSSAFPMTPVTSVTVSQISGKGSEGVSYRITGRIFTPVREKP